MRTLVYFRRGYRLFRAPFAVAMTRDVASGAGLRQEMIFPARNPQSTAPLRARL